MSEKDEAIIATKLDILIMDFQRFRKEQNEHNEARRLHSENEDKVQASILTTQKWHTRIGSAMASAILYILYKISYVGGIH